MAYQYLESTDLKAHIIDQFLTERGEENPTDILETLEKENIQLIRTKLKGRYDIDAIFGATGNERHFLIIKILCKLVVYDFIRRNAGRKVPSDFVKEQEWALSTLEKIKAGKEVPDGLPVLTDDNGDQVKTVHYGNNSNRDFYI